MLGRVPSSVRNIANRLFRIRPTDVAQVVALSVLLIRVEILLRRRPLAEVAIKYQVAFLRDNGAEYASESEPATHYTPTEWRWIKNMKRLLKRWPWDKSCLRRSLLLGWILRHRDPDLMVGTRLDEAGEITAHAWIRLGSVDLDVDALRYLTF